jgi:ABC-2 type transport system permease protein
VAADLLRPVHPVTAYLAADVGRAGHALLGRFIPPVLVGLVTFDLYAPRRWQTLPLFAVSVALALLISFACRYMINAVAFWLHDARGPMILWTVGSGFLVGLYFPLRFLPDWLCAALWLGTPFPSLLQAPLDVLVERDGPAVQAGLVAVQAAWAAGALGAAFAVQRAAERRLVVQGG